MKLGRTLEQVVDKIKKKIDMHDLLKTNECLEDAMSDEFSSEK